MEEKIDEILSVLQDIQEDMGKIAAGRLKPHEEPHIEGMKIEAKPLGEAEAKSELAKAMTMDSEGSPEEEASESSEEAQSEGDEDLPRWKQRLKAMKT